MPADTYTVTISHAGYQNSITQGVTVLGDQNVDLKTIAVSRQVIGRITARSVTSAFQPSQTQDATTLSGTRITEALGSPTNNSEAQLLLSAPGVAETSMGNITIRGSQGTEIGYQLDGVNFSSPFFDENGAGGQFRAGGYLNGFSGGTGGSLQVVNGSGDATQGNIGAGVVNQIVPRGTYPGSGAISYTFGSPYRNNQYDVEYAIANPTGSISNYFSYDHQDYVPKYAPFGTDAATLGEYGGVSSLDHNDLIDNLVFRFGRDLNQSLQVLYRTEDEDAFGNYGGLGNANIYQDNPLAQGNFAPIPLSLYGLTGSQLVGLEQTLPYENTSFPTYGQPEEVGSTQTHYVKIGYTRTLGNTNPTFLQADFYNWAQDQVSENYTTGNAPIYQDVGGQRVGYDLNLTHQFGANHTVTLATRYENSYPRWVGEQPYDESYALEVSPLVEGQPAPGLGDFALPANPSLVSGPGNPCGGGAPFATCYIHDYLVSHGLWTGTMPQVPTFGIDYHGSDFQMWGVGIRDQWTISNKLKLDYGLREDGAQYKFGPNVYQNAANEYANPSDLGTSFLTASFLTPHVVQPRLALVFNPDPASAVRVSYGRSVEFAFGQTAGTPMQLYNVNPVLAQIPALDSPAAPGCGSGYNNAGGAAYKQNPALSTAGPGYFFQCSNYAQQLFWTTDQLFDAPDYGGQGQETFSNYDVQVSHQFTRGPIAGWATSLTGYWRRGFNIFEDVLLSNGPPNPATGQSSGNIFSVRPDGVEKTFGMEFELTTPDRPYGFGGFFTASYLSEFTTVPPAALGSAYASDSLPGLVPQALLNSGTLFRTNTLPPFSIYTGLQFKTKSGFKIAPIFSANTGYPIGVGNMTLTNVNGQLEFVPSTNFGSAGPIGGANGPSNLYNAPNFVDPSLPGSISSPNIAATRGFAEPALAGGKLSSPQDNIDLDLEYDMSHSGHKGYVVGMYIGNLMNNHYGTAYYNTKYQPVATGVSGPQTGLTNNSSNPASPYYAYYLAGVRDFPSYEFGNSGAFLVPYNAGTTLNFYIQRKF